MEAYFAQKDEIEPYTRSGWRKVFSIRSIPKIFEFGETCFNKKMMRSTFLWKEEIEKNKSAS